MSAHALLEPITGRPGAVRLEELHNWQQGRTLYGGASALIAYTHAIRAFPSLPPLRAAQIGFVAPVDEEVELHAEIVREGRNVTHLRSEIRCQGKTTLSAFLLFGTEREANALHPAAQLENPPPAPEECERAMHGKGPSFLAKNFELRYAQEERGPGEPLVRRWARLSGDHGLDPVSELVLIGDVLPPGAMRAMRRQGPISSINWSFNLLETAPETRDGWWLAENTSMHADHGYSSERLRLFNCEGRQMLDGLQCVAIFG